VLLIFWVRQLHQAIKIKEESRKEFAMLKVEELERPVLADDNTIDTVCFRQFHDFKSLNLHQTGYLRIAKDRCQKWDV
jgi:hypothetical protein